VEFRCQDLRDVGVVLVAPESRDYAPLLADIQRSVDHPTFDSVLEEIDPLGAILLNRSAKPIAAWSLIYKYEELSGRAYSSNFRMGVGALPSVLLPFGLSEEMRRVLLYWSTILPGSKRYIGAGEMFGDNTDVRPPNPEEEWKGSSFGFGGRHRHSRPLDQMQHITLVLDGAFFADGECAGPNELQLFEHIVYDAEVYQQVSRVARELVTHGRSSSEVLTAIEDLTGPSRTPIPPPPGQQSDPESFRERARAFLAFHIAGMRGTQSDEKAVETLVSWTDTRLPEYRRR
jgi:hypothetical protein